MKSLRAKDRSAAAIECGLFLYYGFYTKNGKRMYVIENDLPDYIKGFSFYNSTNKPTKLRCKILIYSLITLLVVPVYNLFLLMKLIISLSFYGLFFNVIHNASRPWWDDRLAGIMSLIITIYAVVISFLYFLD